MKKEAYAFKQPEEVELSEYVKTVLSGLDEYSDSVSDKTVQIFSHGMSSYYINTEWET